jgi:hypothetical protein
MIDEFLMGVGGIEESDQFSKIEELKLRAKMRQTIKFKGFIPKCFDNEKQFKKWVRQARVCSPLPPFSVCTDCTPEYKLEMMLQKRCENPHIDFVEKTTRIDVKEGEGWMSYTFLEGEPNLERFEIYEKRGLAE